MKTKILFAAFAVLITGAVTMTKANVENKATSKSVQVKTVNATPQNPVDHSCVFLDCGFIYTPGTIVQ
ncbi:MAG: hypothetical protein LBE92_13645 [Chryseobacterium sp.]|jgi:hypothetical protein|uniref:hypothetical protein n=1 Tax=Chryseobacterium sp. TaxID=1871047 RepID=UPI00283035F9|nr:hypothetical protein [Chryseobacterium sp.]MDR2237160.1 hypothetical protein [Chryseobacterium sp.]